MINFGFQYTVTPYYVWVNSIVRNTGQTLGGGPLQGEALCVPSVHMCEWVL
jgi:hypothetical protein